MANKHCYMHNAVTSREMDGDKGHVFACDVNPRYQRRTRDKPSLKGLLKPAGGATNIEFGGFMLDKEVQALIKRRPGLESKLRDLSGNHIFEGPYPLKQDCGGPGSNMTGRCPPRPASSSKASELKGHNIFLAFSNPYRPPPPPALGPYEPEEMPLPPYKLRRNPAQWASHIMLGGPVCIDPKRPNSTSAWAKQKVLCGSVDMDKDYFPKPVVSDMKARELAGHTNLFGTPPHHSTSPTPMQARCGTIYCGTKLNLAETAHMVHETARKHLHGHDAVFINDSCCLQTPKSQQLSQAKAQEMKGNDIFSHVKPSPKRCHSLGSRQSSKHMSKHLSKGSSRCNFPNKQESCC